jgi:hypothetical protein
MSKTEKKYKSFREFYGDEDAGKPKRQPKENKKNRLKAKQKLKHFNPENISNEDFDDQHFFK